MNAAAIVNDLNQYEYLFEKGINENDEGKRNEIVEKLLSFFVSNGAIFISEVDEAEGQDAIKDSILRYFSLDFLKQLTNVPQGHCVTTISLNEVQVTSYVVAYFRCMPVMVSQYNDILEDIDGRYKIKKRNVVNVQKNYELIAEMQLKGKKQYSMEDK